MIHPFMKHKWMDVSSYRGIHIIIIHDGAKVIFAT